MLPDRFNRLGVDRPLRFVSYIESTGTQYIDTGVKPDFANGDSIEVDFEGSTYPGATPGFFGSRGQYVLNGLYVVAGTCVAAGADGYTGVTCATGGRHLVTIDDTEIINNGTSSAMPRRVTCSHDMFLFGLNANGSPLVLNPDLRIYDWKYYHDGELAQHLVPALLKGNPGMWDMVSRTFFNNAGTGTFNYA